MYPDDTKKVIVSLILDLFYNEMRQLGGSRQENGYRELRAMIMVDEAHQFLKKDFNSFRSIISEGRMFGVGMILSTQNISDFKSSQEDYSSFILSWVIHHVNTLSKTELASVFGPNDGANSMMAQTINSLKQGVSLDYTKGEQIWDYVYSKDAAKAFFCVAKNGVDGKTYVLGSGAERPLSEYLLSAKEIIAPNVKLKMGTRPYSDNQIMYLSGDSTELTHDTGYYSDYTFEDGIREMLNTDC